MKKLIISAMALLVALGVSAQEKKIFNPESGSFSIGVTFNPLALKNNDYQPDINAWSGDFVKGLGNTPKQMFILSTDPLVSFMLNYHFSPVVSLRANFGITGSVVNYKEYVQNDAKYYEYLALGQTTTAQTFDTVTSKLNGTTIGIGLEFTKAFGRLAFVGGVGIQYAMGGGSMVFNYGNPMGEYKGPSESSASFKVPTTAPYLQPTGTGTLNEWESVKNKALLKNTDWSTAYGRPLERYNVGMNHGIGLTADMGLEYFFAGKMSITAAVTFTPVMFVFQPQTKTSYEVWNTSTKRAEVWNGEGALVSPGSTAILYGTQNLGLRFAFKYYL